MNKFNSLFLVLLAILTFCCKINAAERFVIIADAEVPHLMQTTQSLGSFSEKIMPGSSIMLVGGLIALNFNPQFAHFNMASKMQVVAYGDTVDKATLPLLCGIIEKNSTQQPLPESIKVSKNKFFMKQVQGKILMSSSDLLLQNLTSLHKPEKTESDLIINFFPDKYLKQCPGNIAYLRTKFDKELEEKHTHIPDNKSIEKLLHQCRKMRINVDVNKSTVNLKMTVNPVKGSELANFLTAKAPGNIASGDIIKLAKKISGSPAFNLTNSMNGVLTVILTKFFPQGDPNVFAKLCDIRASHDKHALLFNASISQVTVYMTVIAAGAIKKQDGNDI